MIYKLSTRRNWTITFSSKFMNIYFLKFESWMNSVPSSLLKDGEVSLLDLVMMDFYFTVYWEYLTTVKNITTWDHSLVLSLTISSLPLSLSIRTRVFDFFVQNLPYDRFQWFYFHSYHPTLFSETRMKTYLWSWKCR